MARPSDWSPVDMDRDPTPGDPDEVRTLADSLQTFADDVGEALGRIRGMAEDRAVLDWAGLSAEAFRSEFDGVPPNLQKLQTSYDMAAQALQTYWPKLETAQGMADRALDRAIAAQADLSTAQAALTDAQDWVSRAGDEAERLEREGERENVEPPSEAEVRAATRDATAANEAASSAQSRVDSTEEALSAARQLALDAKELREEAARTCASEIDAASDAGIQNRRWWEDAIHWVSENWDTIVEICKVVVAVLGIVVMIIGGPLAWVVLAAALVVLADTLYDYANGRASLWDVAFAALDCIPGMKGLTTLGGLARGMRSLATTGLRGLRQGALGLGRRTRGEGIPMNGRTACGDPVDMATGELLMSAVDIELPGVLPLVIERHHISSYRDGGWFGASWASTLDQRIVLDEYGARLLTADGMTLLYPRPLPDAPVLPVEGPRWELSWDGGPGTPLAVHQPEAGRTLHFAPVPGRPGNTLPLAAVTDRNDNRVDVRYDEHGAPTDVVHSGGYHLGITTDHGRVTELRLLNDPDRPTLLRYGYDAAGLLAEITNSSGRPLTFTYDAHYRLARWEDRNGYWYAYEYDDEGRCVFTTGTDRALEYRYHYQPAAHRTVAVDSLGHSTVYQFNDCYQLIAQTDALGHTSRHDWDRYDRAVATTDPLGRTTTHELDDEGRIVAVIRPDGLATRYEYNELGLPTEITEPDGSVWGHAYDAAGNRTVVLDPVGNRTRYTHDTHGGLATVTDESGRTTRVRCDAAGLPVAVIDPTGEVTRYRRDAFGRLVRVTDPLGATATTSYSPEGKPLRHTDQVGGVQTWTWDGEGNCLSHTDENGGVTSYEYGAFDLPSARVDPDGARYTFTRDTELRLTQVVGPHGLTWDYAYDDAGRLIAETDYDGRTVTYRHDAAGQLVARVNALGQTVAYERDVLGHITTKTAESTATTYAYDPLGQLTRAECPGAEVVIVYDRLGRITSEGVNGLTVDQTHDELGRVLTRTTPSGHTSSWSYNAAGDAVSLTTAGRTLTFDRDPLGRETARRLDDRFALTQTWDPAGRLTGQRLDAAGRQLRQRAFAYRPDHYLTAVAESHLGATSYQLDPAGRVTAVTAPGWTEHYAYDATGQQTEAAWPDALAADAIGDRAFDGTRLTRAGGVRYEYDATGRVTLRQRTRLSRKPESWRYEWDAEDRLTAVTTPDGTRWRYHYDPLGRRIAKERLDADGGVVERTDFVWSGTTLVEQTSTGGPHGRLATLTWDYQGELPVGQTESSLRGEIDRRFYAIVTDLVGAPTELVDETGTIAWQARRTLWGHSAHPDATTATPLRFPGQYADDETGWHYNLLRHYDPAVARYTSPDPLGLTPAPHHYGYVHNPHTWSDPLGLAAHPPTRLSDGHRMPGSIVREYDNIRMGQGTPRIDPNTGRQTIHRADQVPPRQRDQWRGSLEWDVPGTDHRILERPDGRLGYVLNHDYSSPFLFPAPWFPDGGVLPRRLRV
ncbi:DUF6531 domain-containing protein [Streptomyces sp. NPDC127098]|uniref:DUF6531 domain-containing protein n=1 Tax=Streptomyces sp. NPDC127098 TaxID=3347137 RepID=UPI003654F0BC